MKILIVDDEQDIREILAFNLESEGYDIDQASSAEEALQLLSPDHALILLDVMMGGMSGYRLAEQLRKKGTTTPIIFLTAKDTENDMLTGFSVGGDDYIAKPFSLKEVAARVRAVLKRSGAAEPTERIEVGDITLDLQSKEAFTGDEHVSLTKTEFELLALLMANPGRLFSRETIIERLWRDAPYTTERTVDVHITRLRKKLGTLGETIVSRAGYGYKFELK